MPPPMHTPATTRRRRPSVPPLIVCNAMYDETMANAIDTKVMRALYGTGIGRLNASMPTKCIDQMPTPMATAPPSSHSLCADPLPEAATRVAMSRATYDAMTATTYDSATIQSLY